MSNEVFVRGVISYYTENNKKLPEHLDEKGIPYRLVSILNEKAVLMIFINTYLPSENLLEEMAYTTEGEDYDISDSLDEEISELDESSYPYLILTRVPYKPDDSLREALQESKRHMGRKLEVGYRTVEEGNTCVEIATDDTRRKGRVYRILEKWGYKPDRSSEQILELA